MTQKDKLINLLNEFNIHFEKIECLDGTDIEIISESTVTTFIFDLDGNFESIE